MCVLNLAHKAHACLASHMHVHAKHRFTRVLATFVCVWHACHVYVYTACPTRVVCM